MVNKLLLFILFTFIGVNIASAQSANFWITNPSIKGKLTLQHGWVLSDTAAGGIKFTGNVWIGGSQLFLGGSQIKDSIGFIIFSKGIKTRPLSGDPGIAPWINNNMLIDSSVTQAKIKKGSITSAEIAPSLKDSIFSSTTTGVLNTNINTVKTRVDKLFDAKGNFKSTVFGNTLSYDTATAKVSIDTNYYLKARDSTRYLAGGIDTSNFLMHSDTLRFTSSTAFLPRSDTVKFLKFTDTTNFIKKSDSSRYWTKTALDSSALMKKNDTTRYWARANYNPANYFHVGNLDTSNLAKKDEIISADIDSTLWWSRTSYNPANFWQWKNKDTNRYYSVRNLDTSKIWTTNKYKVSAFWDTSTYKPMNYWTYSNKDTNNYWTKARLDTGKYWNKNKYPPSTYYSNTSVNGSMFLDTTSLLKRNQTDVYWSRYDNETGAGWLDSAKLTKKADSTYWRKTNLDTSKFLSRTDIDPAVFTYNGSQITVNNFQMDPKKIDTSKIGVGLRYNGTKLELSRTDTMFTTIAANGKDIIPKFSATFSWQCYFNSTTVNNDYYLTRFPDSTFAFEDNIGYGMPYNGKIMFISIDNQEDRVVTTFTDNDTTFLAQDFLSIRYMGSSGEVWLLKNGAEQGDFMSFVPCVDRITTFTIGVIYTGTVGSY